jgi:hypothetical protein
MIAAIVTMAAAATKFTHMWFAAAAAHLVLRAVHRSLRLLLGAAHAHALYGHEAE